MAVKLHVKKGDQVKVIAGADKGNEGKVLDVDTKKMRVLVEGINMVSKHTAPNAQYPQGGIIKKEAPIHVSNLMVIDGKGTATRIGRKKDEKTGKSVRFSKKTGDVIK